MTESSPLTPDELNQPMQPGDTVTADEHGNVSVRRANGHATDAHADIEQAISLLTREVAQRQKHLRERGKLFELANTAPDSYAQVRDLPLVNLISLGLLSPQMQSAVMMAFEQFTALQNDDAVDALSFRDILSVSQMYEDMGRGACIAGFLHPRVVETEAEADLANAPDVLWVDEIDRKDQQRYLNACMNQDGEEAMALLPFPETGLAGEPHGAPVRASAPAVGDLTVTRGPEPVGADVP